MPNTKIVLSGEYVSLMLLLIASFTICCKISGYPDLLHLDVEYFKFQIDGEDVNMAYHDLARFQESHAVLLMHGKNFWSGYWEKQIFALATLLVRDLFTVRMFETNVECSWPIS